MTAVRLACAALVALGVGCPALDRSNPCDTAGDFDLKKCHDVQGVDPGGEGAFCRKDADCAAHFTCDNRECAFFNTNPDAHADSFAAAEDDAELDLDVLANDEDVDGDALTVVSVSQGRNGIVTIPEDGSGVAYAPLPNANGRDAFTYTVDDGSGGTRTGSVTVEIAAVNDAPEVRTTSIVATEDTTTTVQLLLADADGDSVSVSDVLATAPAHGAALVSGNALQYTPAPNFFGADSVEVSVTDGRGAPVVRAIAIDVLPVNDPPVAVLPAPGNAVDEDGDTVVQQTFDASASSDVDDAVLTYAWLIDDVPQAIADPIAALTFTPGGHIVTVVVTDAAGASTAAATDVFGVPTRLFADANAVGAGTGFTWDDAAVRLEDAIATTTVISGIREIWVAAGVYTAPAAGFPLVPGVALLGGFVGGETLVDERDFGPGANETVLSGDGFGDDAAGFANRGENSPHVVRAELVPNTAVLDGFTIRGGHARLSGGGAADDNEGAAFYIRDANPVLKNLVVTDNVAECCGLGGIISSRSSSPFLIHVVVFGNVADADIGGAFGAAGGAPVILSSMFLGTQGTLGGAAANVGGGLGFVSSQAIVISTLIAGNAATFSAAAHGEGQNSQVTLRFVTISGNVSSAGPAVDGMFFTANAIVAGNVPLDDAGTPAGVMCAGPGAGIVFASNFAGPDGVPHTPDDDYTLGPGSCGIDAGNGAFLITSTEDARGRPRILGGGPDLGAFESQP